MERRGARGPNLTRSPAQKHRSIYDLNIREADLSASDALVAARETAALTAVLRIHLDKEDEYLYPTLKERTSLEEQSAIVGGMAAHVPPGRNPEFIRWLFTLLGHDDREMWTRVVMGLMPEQVFAGVKALIRDTITDDWAELTRRIPELAS